MVVVDRGGERAAKRMKRGEVNQCEWKWPLGRPIASASYTRTYHPTYDVPCRWYSRRSLACARCGADGETSARRPPSAGELGRSRRTLCPRGVAVAPPHPVVPRVSQRALRMCVSPSRNDDVRNEGTPRIRGRTRLFVLRDDARRRDSCRLVLSFFSLASPYVSVLETSVFSSRRSSAIVEEKFGAVGARCSDAPRRVPSSARFARKPASAKEGKSDGKLGVKERGVFHARSEQARDNDRRPVARRRHRPMCGKCATPPATIVSS